MGVQVLVEIMIFLIQELIDDHKGFRKKIFPSVGDHLGLPPVSGRTNEPTFKRIKKDYTTKINVGIGYFVVRPRSHENVFILFNRYY